jgi:hypothetical protein
MTRRRPVLAATVSTVAAVGTALLLLGGSATPAGTPVRLAGTALVAIPPTPHPTPRSTPHGDGTTPAGPVSASPAPAAAPPHFPPGASPY